MAFKYFKSLIILLLFFNNAFSQNFNNDSLATDSLSILWPFVWMSESNNHYDEPPKLIKKVPIQFPSKEFKEYVFRLIVEVEVHEDGSVRPYMNYYYISSLEFEQYKLLKDWQMYNAVFYKYLHAAMESISKWKFKPAALNGKPVGSIVNIVIHFNDPGFYKRYYIYEKVGND